MQRFRETVYTTPGGSTMLLVARSDYSRIYVGFFATQQALQTVVSTRPNAAYNEGMVVLGGSPSDKPTEFYVDRHGDICRQAWYANTQNMGLAPSLVVLELFEEEHGERTTASGLVLSANGSSAGSLASWNNNRADFLLSAIKAAKKG